VQRQIKSFPESGGGTAAMAVVDDGLGSELLALAEFGSE
jgi:hypothetical protein